MKKIVRMSRFFKWSAVALCAALPLIEAGYWITEGYPFLEPFLRFDPLPSFGGRALEWTHLNELQKLFGFLINLMPLAFSVVALLFLSRLFAAFEKLSFFERKNVQILRRSGLALLWGQLFFPIYTAFLSLTLTCRNPVGERNISVGWGGQQFEILAIALSILLISWILEEAVKVHEEQAATV